MAVVSKTGDFTYVAGEITCFLRLEGLRKYGTCQTRWGLMILID